MLEGKRTQTNKSTVCPVYVGNIAGMVFGLKSTVCPVYFGYVEYVLFLEKYHMFGMFLDTCVC